MRQFRHLTPEDLNSVTWVRLKRELGERLYELRCANDAPQAEELTAALRGQIAEVKFWLESDRPPVDISEMSADVGY